MPLVMGAQEWRLIEKGLAQRARLLDAVLAEYDSVVTSLLALVVGEQINANAGLGFMISQAEQFLQNSVIMVALLVYAILGLLADALVRLLERRALRWRPEFTR